MAIDKRIKLFRNRKSMTQKQLGEITREEYDEWLYKYPELDTHQIWAKIPPQELFDFINEATKEAESTEKKKNTRRKNEQKPFPFQLSFLKISKVFLLLKYSFI